MVRRPILFLLLIPALLTGETVKVPGLKRPVEILRDRWGVPHIYAQNTEDLFFANGYINARDRLFQIDLWRRAGTGKLAEIQGYGAVRRDRMARLFRFRGDWNAEWQSYSPDARQIATAFAHGVNAYIQSLNGVRPIEFRTAGYDPGLWVPEDCTARIAGLSISQNLVKEVEHAQDIVQFGLDALFRQKPLQPPVAVTPPPGINLADVNHGVIREFVEMLSAPGPAQGSNNWAVDGTRSATGKPILASDPHRVIGTPSLRKTVHLVAPGWNAMGAGEPALPGIALGHNEDIAFGFTITGTDQQDLYVEKINPKNSAEYWYQGAWKPFQIEKEKLSVKGETKPREVELRFSVHGPVIYEDRAALRAYALRWVGMEPGGAGYLGGLSTARAKNWNEFKASVARFKVPSENMVYADRAGNIGFIVAGLAPVRKNWTGLLPVPGSGEYEWSGFIPPDQMPMTFNPPRHFVASANNNILPPGYNRILTYQWGPSWRIQRIQELLAGTKKFTVADFEAMQYDVMSMPARRFQATLRRWKPAPGTRHAQIVQRMLQWDARMTVESTPGLIYELWFPRVASALFGPALALRTDYEVTLRKIESLTDFSVLRDTLDATLAELDRHLGTNMDRWRWGALSKITFQHDLHVPQWSRGPITRPGDPHTINSFGIKASRESSGASYRQVIDLADWDRSMMTNAPGESGEPGSSHYADLIEGWANGRYHPMPFSRKAVEAATEERIQLIPAVVNP
ncbi:MAG TPA: penicillin acylase family protein [Bryobacteraceae bacterium]|nr:penicillin acylase family protein [Bryobacteraceae bacterium]